MEADCTIVVAARAGSATEPTPRMGSVATRGGARLLAPAGSDSEHGAQIGRAAQLTLGQHGYTEHVFDGFHQRCVGTDAGLGDVALVRGRRDLRVRHRMIFVVPD